MAIIHNENDRQITYCVISHRDNRFCLDFLQKIISVGKWLSIELTLPYEKIVYDCLHAIFVNFTIGFNVKVLQLRDAISHKLGRRPIYIFLP